MVSVVGSKVREKYLEKNTYVFHLPKGIFDGLWGNFYHSFNVNKGFFVNRLNLPSY